MRIGSIEFINSLPVDYGMVSGLVGFDSEVEVVTSYPADLNDKILKGDLDISEVSALWYAQHQDKFLLIPDLSISSYSGVKSVLLISRKPLAELTKDSVVAVTSKGKTTPAMLEIICRVRYGFKPVFKVTGKDAKLNGIPADHDAILLIGDDALIAANKWKLEGLVVTDLAQEWKDWTGHPFVFALWVCRRDFFALNTVDVFKACKALYCSRDYGTNHLDEVVAHAATKTGLPADVISDYFKALTYDFTTELQDGLRHFLELAMDCDLLDSFGELETISQSRASLRA